MTKNTQDVRPRIPSINQIENDLTTASSDDPVFVLFESNKRSASQTSDTAKDDLLNTEKRYSESSKILQCAVAERYKIIKVQTEII